MIDVSSYALKPLRQGANFVLYRGHRETEPSNILVVVPVLKRLAQRTLRRLEHEYALRTRLETDWAVLPLDLVSHDGRTVLVLDDPGGQPLSQILGHPLEVIQFLRIASGIASAVGKVHEHGLIHKDIKPANILADPITNRVWLTGFSIASELPRERQAPEPLETIAGTLAYMAPEQTGRMNRSIDSRSDLYSLGVTLYEILTGSRPFTASDPMEWVHCHIARQPIPPGERGKEIPPALSAIILKLLAKTAEERYQTASGVKHDLERCLDEYLRSSGVTGVQEKIHEFPLGEHDTPDRLLIPEKLYGRAREINTLVASFDRVVASGTPELVLVSGYSGIGKSSVVNELQKVLVSPRGLFASGKFDQYKRDIPYATLAQAFQSLIRPLLSKSETELRNWRDALQEALGPNAQLMVDLVPELTLILGQQPPVPDLPLQGAQRRFQLVFRRFIGVFARREHPLALFLDDLQWLDAATLDFLENVLTQTDVHHLMLIGAYRDNEVNSAHPLIRKLEAIRQAGAAVQEVILAPLACEDLGQLIADALHCELERATPLAQVVHDKTAGNPFFAIQFISALTEEALLTFDHGNGRWFWDLNRIHGKGYTGNVVDLMVGKLNRLPLQTQKVLQELACLGNSAKIPTLSIVHQTSEDELHSDLWEAVRLEYVVRFGDSYKYVHDRVQEAAYSLIPEEMRAEAHLRIGRLLMSTMSAEELAENTFDVANQLNHGVALISERDEQRRVAELNLHAGRKAKTSAAYAAACAFLSVGATLIDREDWEDRYEFAFGLALLRAECEFLCGRFDEAEKLISWLLRRAMSKADKAAAYRLRTDLHILKSSYREAVNSALECLRLFGITMSVHPTKEQVQYEYEKVWRNLGERSIESLIDLPLMSDPEVQAAMRVLSVLYSPAFFIDTNLFFLSICHIVNLSLKYGPTDASAHGYAYFGFILGPAFNRYAEGYRFGQLGVDLVEKHGFVAFKAKVYMTMAWVAIWTQPITTALKFIRAAFSAAVEIGDLTYACYACDHTITDLIARGDHLDEVWLESEQCLEFVRKAKSPDYVDRLKTQRQFIQNLRGCTYTFSTFNDAHFDEAVFEAQLANDQAIACWYWILKLQARFVSGDYEAAMAAAEKAKRLLWAATGCIQLPDYHYYTALTIGALFDTTAPDRKKPWREALAEHLDQLRGWAENCSATFLDKHILVSAEVARIEGRTVDAMGLYEQAIRSAHANGFVHNEALANELAGRFYAARGFTKIAHAYFQDARYCYLRWGATAKVRQLDELYPQLREQEPVAGPTTTIEAAVQQLDLADIIKVSQALSSEIVLEKLIDTLMRTAIEHAGAERGLLILPRGVAHQIVAEATTSGNTIIVHLQEAFVAEAELPESIINYVVRTQESVILDGAFVQSPFSEDPYIRALQARSILCLPLINQAKLIGLLYLENNLSSHVFTPKRITMLKLIASQAAISLENTRLYRDLEEREGKIRRLVDANIIGILIWNLEGQILEANQAFLQMIQYTREDLMSGRLRWTDLTPLEWRDRDERSVAELKATGSIQPFEKEYFRKNGSRVPVLIGATIFEGSRNEGVAFVLDLSEQKRAEEEIKRIRRLEGEMRQVSRTEMMGGLTASLAHELSQPLGAVHLNAETARLFLAAKSPELDKVKAAIDDVIQDNARAAEIIRNIRALFQRAEVEKLAVDLRQILYDVERILRADAASKGVALQLDVPTALPPVMGNKTQLIEAVMNLVSNGVDSVCESGEAGSVEICASQPEAGRVRVLVRDSGRGIEPEVIPRLFDAFFTTKPKGMGMGLAIVRSIIENHGGRLWATPNPDRGATFEFELPVKADLH